MRAIPQLRRFDVGDPIHALAWSPDGTRLALARGRQVAVHTAEGVALWDHPTTLEAPADQVVWGADGLYAVGGGAFYGFTPRGAMRSAPMPTGALARCAPDGRRVVSAHGADVTLWPPRTGRDRLEDLGTMRAPVTAFAWAPDGAGLAWGLEDGRVEHHQLDEPRATDRAFALGGPAERLAVDPARGGLVAALAGGRLVAVEPGGAPRLLRSGGVITALVCAGDGRVAVGVGDRIELWAPGRLERIAEFAGPGGAIHALEFDPAGARLAAAGEDGVVQLYDVSARPSGLDRGDPALLRYVARQAATIGRRPPAAGTHLPTAPAQLDAAIRRLPEQQRELMTLLHLDGKSLLDAAHLLGLPVDRARRLAEDARRALGHRLALLGADPTAPVELDALPAAVVALTAAGRSASLALILDVLRLVGGQRPTGPGARLVEHPHARRWARPSWSPLARVALALLLLREYDDPDFTPPDVAAGTLAWHLARALSGPAIEPTPTTAVLAPIEAALAEMDPNRNDGIGRQGEVAERLTTLIDGLGPVACANDPGLLLRLYPRLSQLIPMALPQRRLMGLRLPTEIAGRAQSDRTGFERAGLTLSGDPRTLLPSQWALPEEVVDWRHARGGLLYRARTGREAPRLRPTVLVLDVTPASLPIEDIIRPAAFTLARTLLDAGVPAWLIAAGGQNILRPLSQPADIFEILTAFSDDPIDYARTAKHAARLRDSLRDGDLEPVVVLMSHPWFAMDHEDEADIPDARALFVRYGAMDPPSPAFAPRCARHEVLGPFDLDALTPALARLLA